MESNSFTESKMELELNSKDNQSCKRQELPGFVKTEQVDYHVDMFIAEDQMVDEEHEKGLNILDTNIQNEVMDECEVHVKLEHTDDIESYKEDYPEFIKIEGAVIKDEQENADDSVKNDDDCFKSTGLLIGTNPVPMGAANRAALTVPEGFLELGMPPLRPSGVYALSELVKGTQLGPYEGKTTKVESRKGCSWKLNEGKLLDTSDETTSNYLRYINFTRNESQQNLTTFQHKGELYYVTCRDVQKGEELLIYFSNTSDDLYYKPSEDDLSVSKLSTSEENQQKKHVCDSCNFTTNHKKDLESHRCVKQENLFKLIMNVVEDPASRKRRLANERQKRWRAKQSQESRAKIRALDAASHRVRICQMTPEQLAAHRVAHAAAQRQYVNRLTPQQLEALHANNAASQRKRMKRMTPEQLAAHRVAHAASQRRHVGLNSQQRKAHRVANRASHRLSQQRKNHAIHNG